MDKAALIAQLVALLSDELNAARRVARETAEAANHPEARPDSDKDTRKIELSYLAAGQASRAAELETGLMLLSALSDRPIGEHEPLQAGALIELDADGKKQRVFLSPAGGGLKLKDERGAISVVTPQSPLGRALLERSVGDSVELVLAGQSRELEIVGVS